MLLHTFLTFLYKQKSIGFIKKKLKYFWEKISFQKNLQYKRNRRSYQNAFVYAHTHAMSLECHKAIARILTVEPVSPVVLYIFSIDMFLDLKRQNTAFVYVCKQYYSSKLSLISTKNLHLKISVVGFVKQSSDNALIPLCY